MKIVFGASNGGKQYLKTHRYTEIDFFIDNDVKKQNKDFLGYEVKNPDVLKLLDKKNLRIAIASDYYSEIKNQLLEYGLVEGIHFWNGINDININDSSISNTKFNLEKALQLEANYGTAKFINKYLPNVSSCNSSFAVLNKAIQAITLEGIKLEFGVFEGRSINYISNKVDKIYGFDSFKGLPEYWIDGYPKGAFNLEELPDVNNNVELIVGWFDETLPNFLEQYKDVCAFIHIDSDLYSSAKIIFDNLKDRITSGTVIVFDEYFNYPGWEMGEHKAFSEFINCSNLKFEYLTFNKSGTQLAIKIL
ncbi:class I SAM-dependent methyltransferase [Lysinibacillus antri]|uniref:Class I SAM-dependent methyltransferase n=1 Tax=Lysinibacillus antri TaxID=2498145 RepID=A0A432LDA3_9BACI|nr:class I SAM-dependent methyltransferase [Lysinibacillus antri]RUL54201.1 class I SAM-dependent methyltransferase [Lysinibacillus antri]